MVTTLNPQEIKLLDKRHTDYLIILVIDLAKRTRMQKTSEVYKHLYHYTTWEGLKNILQTQSLWATNYKFLNDYSEIILFRDKLIDFILPVTQEGYEKLIAHKPFVEGKIQEEGGLKRNVQRDTEALIDAQYRAIGSEIYILSFCGEPEKQSVADNGLLSQWRGYGTGGGAALVFDTEKLEEIIAKEVSRYQYNAVLLADLIYSDDEQKFKEELSDEINTLAGIAKQYFDHEEYQKGKEIDSSNGYIPFIKCTTRYKHFGFSEEKEVRVVALPALFNEEYIKMAKETGTILKPEKVRKSRFKNGQRVPYIELFEMNEIKLPIKKIIIGPHKDKEIRKIELREVLSETNIDIACSEIPYADR